MRVLKQFSLGAGWFLCLGLGLLLRDLVILSSPSPSLGGPIFLIVLGMAGLEITRRRIERDTGEARPLIEHLAAPLIVGLLAALVSIWMITINGTRV